MPTPPLRRFGAVIRFACLVATPALHPALARADPTIAPGQEALLLDMAGRGEVLPGECRLADARVEPSVARARYACGRDGRTALAVELRHPSTRGARAWTRNFAMFVESEPPAPDFLGRLTARIMARERAWIWSEAERADLGRDARSRPSIEVVGPLLAVALLLVGAWLGRGQRSGTTDGSSPPSLPPLAQRYLGCVAAAAVAWRLWLSDRYPLDVLELLALRRSLDREFIPFLSGNHNIYNVLHAPLHPALLALWLKLGVALGCAPERIYLRALNLPFAALSILLPARIGALLGAPAAGVAAATVVAFAPAFLLLSIEQGNYLYEMLGALWFAERCLRYVAWGQPVLRSLAVAAALAVWSGYMNAFVVGPGLALVAAVAVRRGAGRAALGAGLLFAGAVAPLVRSAFEAGRGYLELSVSVASSTARAAAIMERTGHRPLPLTESFGGGSFLSVLAALPGELLGDAGVIVALGAALLIWRQRWRALPLLGAIALSAAVGTRVTLGLHNYAIVWPAVVLVATWGVHGLTPPSGWHPSLDGAVRRRRFTAALQAALAACCLLAAHRRTPLMRLPATLAPQGLLQWWDARPFERALARAPADLPVMVYQLDHHVDVGCLLCAHERSLAGWIRCAPQELRMGDATRVDGWWRGRRGVRETAWRADASDPRARLESARSIVREWAWRTRGWLVLRGVTEGPLTDLDEYFDRRCAAVARRRNLVMLRCPPDTASAPAASRGGPPSMTAPARPHLARFPLEP